MKGSDHSVLDFSFDDIVSRYQRSRDGRSIVYMDAQLSLGEAERHLELLQCLDGHIVVLNWIDPCAAPLQLEKAVMQLILVRAELQVVITRWQLLVDELALELSAQTSSGSTDSNVYHLLELDVLLIDALDVLYSLEITAFEYVPGYECIIPQYASYRESMTRSRTSESGSNRTVS